jgi:hypothetical protein
VQIAVADHGCSDLPSLNRTPTEQQVHAPRSNYLAQEMSQREVTERSKLARMRTRPLGISELMNILE